MSKTAQPHIKACTTLSITLRGQAMNIPIPPETPDPNIDDPSLPPPVPEEAPDETPVKPTEPPTVGDPPSQEPPVKA
ncbi:hypothetical protein [Pseudomonas sp. NPDC089758]|uniref:hypothetical protein n=1 Tax=Pseudomonas sp. NPDC089758 TaxID=3364473 RepID=UPI00382E6654